MGFRRSEVQILSARLPRKPRRNPRFSAFRQIKLVKGEEQEDAAWEQYHVVMAERGRAIPARKVLADPTVTQVCNLFLDWSKANHAERTYGWYRDILKDFCDYAGKIRLSVGLNGVDSWLKGDRG